MENFMPGDNPLAGLLGPQKMMDPTVMGLLSAAAAGMQASGPSRTPTSIGQTFGAALGAGMPAYMQTQQFNNQRQMQGLQTAKMLSDMAQTAQKRNAIQDYAAGLPEADRARFLADPESFLKEEGKGQVVSPGASVVRGGKPVYTAPEKTEYGTTPHYEKGPDNKIYAVYSDKQGNRRMVEATPMNQFTTPSVDAQNRLGFDSYKFNNLSQEERFRLGLDTARLANQGIETNFNTGQGVTRPMMGGVPQNAPMPAFGQSGFAPTQSQQQQPMAPQAPQQAAPRPMQPMGQSQLIRPSASGLTPKAEMDVKKDRALMDNKRSFNMSGIGEVLKSAESLLSGRAGEPINGIPTESTKPTSSMFGSFFDSALGAFGASTKSADVAAKLKSIGGKLVTMMPRMEGPQSDKDVLLYREMAGKVGDDWTPLSQRLAALDTIRELYGKYEGGAGARSGASGGWSVVK